MKKFMSVLLSVLMILTCFTSLAYAEKEGEKEALKFNEDGKFTILNISDIQDGYPLNPLTKDYIEKTLDKVNPDLVILTGDNISGYDVEEEEDAEKAIREFMDIFEERNVMVAAVFGNHDDAYADGKYLHVPCVNCIFIFWNVSAAGRQKGL